MKKRIIFILGLLCLWAAGPKPAYAQPGPSGAQRDLGPEAVYHDGGNVFRIVTTTPSSGYPVLISSQPENASLDGSTNTLLGIDNYRGRYVVNTCTAARMAILPADPSTGTYTVFRSSYGIVLASAPASNVDGLITTTVGDKNAMWIYSEAELWAIWDPNASKCTSGAAVLEQMYLTLDSSRKLRKIGR